ncbi:hypothetical protein [Nocardia blacklockiae]|uniref:hypothetical protein n=1 Tax=Nocardia blacklockiae TaxID=480036 RepID=UPI00189588D7|nr:hypothetical protein [Nocardia blacklockiae]MBF6175996.1 hypothetical protein [Nocardia blacklockiae]
MSTQVDPARAGHRDRVKALLAWTVERRLCARTEQLPGVVMDSVWDSWWVSYRAATSTRILGIGSLPARSGCSVCRRDAAELGAMEPPGHPEILGPRACECLQEWAQSMRAAAPEIIWPAWRLSCALTKPGADSDAVRTLLARSYQMVDSRPMRLRPSDARRLYPDAYGAEYTLAQDDYLTSGPVRAFLLLADPDGRASAKDIKTGIRRRLGGTDILRNHLHMPDNPGDAWCDIAHLFGPDTLTALYERYEHDHAADRMDRHRHLLDPQPTGPHRG